MNHRLTAVAAALAATLAVAACSNSGTTGEAAGGGEKGALPTDQATSDAATALPTPSASGSATSGFGSVKDAGDIPDPCTLLSQTEVKQLTGRAITQTDKDNASPGTTARFCQWQQDSGQLALFLSRTTPSDYTLKIDGAVPTEGVKDPASGDDLKAFTLAGHLYVLFGTVEVDVYSRGGDDGANLAEEKKVIDTVLPKI